jgi:hypothetical protein
MLLPGRFNSSTHAPEPQLTQLSYQNHRHFAHPVKRGRITVPGHPAVDVTSGTIVYRKTGGLQKMRYPVISEKSATGWVAYIPFYGCVAFGFPLDERSA